MGRIVTVNPDLAATRAPDEHATLVERVDIIKAMVYGGGRRGRPRLLRWGMSRVQQETVLRTLDTTPEHEKRELAWMLIAQGLDTRLVGRLGGSFNRAYRAFVREWAPDLRRARDLRRIAPYSLGGIPKEIAAKDVGDVITGGLRRLPCGIRGHDTILVQAGARRAFVTTMDGWIWRVALDNPSAEPFVRTPLMPAGIVEDPNDSDRLYFCCCRHSGQVYPTEERGGIYTLTISNRAIQRLVDRVPNPPIIGGDVTEGIVYSGTERLDLPIASLSPSNSRPACYFNDVAISGDGRLLFCTESSPDTSMGSESEPEAITLARNGLLWRVDLEGRSISLAAQNYAFTDGILAEGNGESVLMSELTRFRILRLRLDGPGAGRDEELWRDLPGMPDGMHRDEDGRIWVALLSKRTAFENWLHRNPWCKPLLLSLPVSLPAPGATGFLVLSPDGSEPVYFAMYSGKKLRDVSAVAATSTGIFLASFNPNNRGLNRIDPSLFA
ncbi:MAG: SMP-30/gluconolactonase/LRE family protein [Gemmatimonadetes bacterium]|nr:SMP-30/gluconolactonase/LRE family protein [Gemmatimonadota bacterium]